MFKYFATSVVLGIVGMVVCSADGLVGRFVVEFTEHALAEFGDGHADSRTVGRVCAE